MPCEFLIEFLEIGSTTLEEFFFSAFLQSIFSELLLEAGQEYFFFICTMDFVVREEIFECLMYRCSIACRLTLGLRKAEDIIRDEVCGSSRGHIEEVLESSSRQAEGARYIPREECVLFSSIGKTTDVLLLSFEEHCHISYVHLWFYNCPFISTDSSET